MDKVLDDFERAYGVPRLAGEADGVALEAERLLNLPPDQVRKLTAEGCGESAFVLGQYAHRLQQALNREQSRATWADASIRKVIARKVPNYKGYSYEERRAQAVADDDAATKLDQLRVKAQLRIDRLSFLATRAGDLMKTLMGLMNTKRGRHHD